MPLASSLFALGDFAESVIGRHLSLWFWENTGIMPIAQTWVNGQISEEEAEKELGWWGQSIENQISHCPLSLLEILLLWIACMS